MHHDTNTTIISTLGGMLISILTIHDAEHTFILGLIGGLGSLCATLLGKYIISKYFSPKE